MSRRAFRRRCMPSVYAGAFSGRRMRKTHRTTIIGKLEGGLKCRGLANLLRESREDERGYLLSSAVPRVDGAQGQISLVSVLLVWLLL